MMPTMTMTPDFSSSDSEQPSRGFSISLAFRFTRSKDKSPKLRMSLQQIKLKFELLIQDVHGVEADRMRYKIRGTREVKDLWLLRSDLHQLIAMKQSQTIASEKINALLPCFAGWLPSKQLSKI
jgi:hypothetical protein